MNLQTKTSSTDLLGLISVMESIDTSLVGVTFICAYGVLGFKSQSAAQILVHSHSKYTLPPN